jgi:hypothetical protein
MSDIKKQGDSDPALARLLAEALRPPDGAASDETCPDAELLAAYADHNLDAAESAHWEEHFAGCARCQNILAVLTVSSEEPLGEAEVERFGRRAAAAGSAGAGVEPRSAEVKKVAPFARPRTAWRWMAPAAGIAAAAALWIALRPAPPHGTSAVTAQKTTAQPSAASGESLEAKADVPAPPAAASREAEPSPPGPQQLKAPALAQPQAKKNEQAANMKEVPQQSAAQADSAAAAPQSVGGLQASAPASAENSPEARLGDESPAAASATGAPRPAPNAGGAAGGAAATAAQAAAPAPANGAEAKSAENRPLQAFAARGIVAGLAGRAPVVLASPNRVVLWRLGLGGRIDRSADQGRTWQEQPSGVTSDLLAGTAPSDKVAWVAGRAGVILRTTDGEHWQRVASPAAATDWTSIEASDALHATIVSSDRRRFATEDGGQTWK